MPKSSVEENKVPKKGLILVHFWNNSNYESLPDIGSLLEK